MRALVIGVPGVGKTTILSFLESNVKIVNYGDVMFSLAKKYVSTRDEMRSRIPPRKYREIQKKAAEKISRMKNVVIDTHLSILSDVGYCPGIPLDVAKKLKPNIVIILEKNPGKIHEQARNDRSRKRNYTLRQIKEHQEINRMYGVALSEATGCFLKVVNIPAKEKRKFDGSKKAAKEIDRVIMAWSSKF